MVEEPTRRGGEGTTAFLWTRAERRRYWVVDLFKLMQEGRGLLFQE